MPRPKLRELEKQAAQARAAIQEAAEDFASRLGELSDDARLTGDGKVDAARQLARERRDELSRLGEAEVTALTEYADATESVAMRRPWDERSPMASKPQRKAFVGRDGTLQTTRYREAVMQWREGLQEASFVEQATRTALASMNGLPPEVLSVRFERALEEADEGTARAVQALALRRMCEPAADGETPQEADRTITEADWPAWALCERELGDGVRPVPSGDPAGWRLIQRLAAAEEARMDATQLDARRRVMTGAHKVEPTSVDAALTGEGVVGQVRLAAEDGLSGDSEPEGGP